MIEIKFTNDAVVLRPIFSVRNPDKRQPTGEAIAVIDANQETCETVKGTFGSFKRSSDEIDGKPKPMPEEITDKLWSNETAT